MIRISGLAPLITHTRNINLLGNKWGFSDKKLYKPMMPLNDPKFNLIFAQDFYMKGELTKTRSFFFFWIPAALVAINNYLTEWTLLNGTAFTFLFLGGFFIKKRFEDTLSMEVYSIEVTPDMKTFYFVVPISGFMGYYWDLYFKHGDQEGLGKDMDYYSPMVGKGVDWMKDIK